MNADQRVKAAAKLLVQAPPGEINDCLTGVAIHVRTNDVLDTNAWADIRVIIDDDNRLQAGIDNALREYNIDQFITFQPAGADHQVCHPLTSGYSLTGNLCRLSSVMQDVLGQWKKIASLTLRRGNLTILIICVWCVAKAWRRYIAEGIQEASADRDEEIDEDLEPFRYSFYARPLVCVLNVNVYSAALDSAAQEYITDHYKEGVASVFVPSPNKLTIQLVANRYNPSNFWSGRWRSRYEIDLDSKSITGVVNVHVHYYEQGNVNLSLPE